MIRLPCMLFVQQYCILLWRKEQGYLKGPNKNVPHRKPYKKLNQFHWHRCLEGKVEEHSVAMDSNGQCRRGCIVTHCYMYQPENNKTFSHAVKRSLMNQKYYQYSSSHKSLLRPCQQQPYLQHMSMVEVQD